jgi:hypothetical protein
MNDLTITVGLIVTGGPDPLRASLEPLLGQLQEGDSLLIVLTRGTRERRSCYAIAEEAASSLPRDVTLRLLEETGGRLAALNGVIDTATDEVAVFLEDGWVPAARWLSAWRATFRDDRVDGGAGPMHPEDHHWERLHRSGGRLRWTGHVAVRWEGARPAATSLADARNCALRLGPARKAGGFDSGLEEAGPFADVEFFTRLIKTGARMQYVPGAGVSAFTGPVGPRPPEDPSSAMERAEEEARWMATVFARHEVWALPILMGSHLIESFVDILAGTLPREALGRVARAVVDGVRRAGRPVEGVERGAGVPRR